jgi:hypothetical protein
MNLMIGLDQVCRNVDMSRIFLSINQFSQFERSVGCCRYVDKSLCLFKIKRFESSEANAEQLNASPFATNPVSLYVYIFCLALTEGDIA